MTATNPFLAQIIRERENESSVSRFHEYETPLVTVDVVIFTVQDQRLKVLLIKRRHEPYIHHWALPGGFIRSGESLQDAAERRLFEETHVKDVYLQQIRAFGKPKRDPRARVISIGFYALVGSTRIKPIADSDAEDVGWYCVTELPTLAFDHNLIITTALQNLQVNLEDTPVAFQLLTEKFTLTELQKVYELIENKPLDKRNFRKKMLSSGILTETGELKKEGRHRPAQLYRFTTGMPDDDVEENPEALKDVLQDINEPMSKNGHQ